MKFHRECFYIVKLRTILLDLKHVSPLLTLIIIIITILIKPWKYINLPISMDIHTLILSFLFSLIFVMNKKWKIRFFSCILATKLKFITWLYFGNKKWFGLKNKNKNVDIGCSLPLKFWGPYIWLFHKEVAKYVVLSYILIEVSHVHQPYTIPRKTVYPPPISKVASPLKYF